MVLEYLYNTYFFKAVKIMKRKVSLSIGHFQNTRDDFEALTIAKNVGADAVDFDTCGPRWDYRNPNSIYSKSEDEFDDFFTRLKKHADSLGIEIGQTHGRIQGFKNIKEEDDALIVNAGFDCRAASLLGAPVVIIHSVGSGPFGADADPKFMQALNFDMFTRMLPYAKKYNVKLASETFGDCPSIGCCDFFGDIDQFIISYNKVCAVDDNAKYMSCCVDTGHSNKATRFNNNPSPADVIRMLGPNISTLHLHDNDTFTDQHKIPMTGTIDWKDVFNALDEINYCGNYNMEMVMTHFGKGFAVEMAEFSIKLMRYLLRERYGDNA